MWASGFLGMCDGGDVLGGFVDCHTADSVEDGDVRASSVVVA